MLFGRIYDRFSVDVLAAGVFLACLEPYIIDDRLRSLPPVVMRDLVLHYESHNKLSSVEACLVHLDIASLDIHHVGLYDLLTYSILLAPCGAKGTNESPSAIIVLGKPAYFVPCLAHCGHFCSVEFVGVSVAKVFLHGG